MKIALVVCAAGLCFQGTGCALVQDTGRNFVVSVGRCAEEFKERRRNKTLANDAWRQVAQTGAYSSHYADGFKEGVAEYLFRGDGEPPLMAPARYRRSIYQTAEGHRAVQEWFAGYRHGAADAQARGWRQWVVGPSSLVPVADASPWEAPEPAAQAQVSPGAKTPPSAGPSVFSSAKPSGFRSDMEEQMFFAKTPSAPSDAETPPYRATFGTPSSAKSPSPPSRAEAPRPPRQAETPSAPSDAEAPPRRATFGTPPKEHPEKWGQKTKFSVPAVSSRGVAAEAACVVY